MYARDSANQSQDEALRRGVDTARLAPSGHNMQPWRFRLGADYVDLLTDRTRHLPALDPEGREMVMSCGAALFYLRLALRHEGYAVQWEILPDPSDNDLMARVRPGARLHSTGGQERLFAVIPDRRTNRLSFYTRPLPEGLLPSLVSAAKEEGARLVPFLNADERDRLIDFVGQGASDLGGNPAFREEMAQWTSAPQGEGFVAENGVTNYPEYLRLHLTYDGPFWSPEDPGNALSAHERRLASEAPLLAAISTDTDTPAAWLAAGQAVANVLLHAAAKGVMAAFLNAPLQVHALRTKTALLCGGAYPQLLLALGYAPCGRKTPRRPLRALLIEKKPNR